MATTLFEDKLSEYIGLCEKASHGYYISNGMFRENIEKVDINLFIVAVKMAERMFQLAFENKTKLITEKDKLYGNEGFWNDLKRQELRYLNIEQNQLSYESSLINVLEIIAEIKNENPQVMSQARKAIEYNLTILPILYFRLKNNKKKAKEFELLRSQLLAPSLLPNLDIPELDFGLSPQLPEDEEILSWFTKKEEDFTKRKEQHEQDFKANKQLIEKEKQGAIEEANKAVELAMAEAKKIQEDAIKLMAEMQKKHGLN